MAATSHTNLKPSIEDAAILRRAKQLCHAAGMAWDYQTLVAKRGIGVKGALDDEARFPSRCCGWAFHRNRWGHCAPNRYGYYRPYRYWQPYGPGYYGDRHEPWNRPSPGDHVADRLNRQVLHGRY